MASEGETGLADGMYLLVVRGMHRKLGEIRNSGAATLQRMWNVRHTTHAFEIRKLDWAISYFFMDKVQYEHAYHGGGVVWRIT